MTHLRIEQNHNDIESLGDNDSVIEKIYELVSSNSLDKSSNFIGKVSVRATYDKYLDLINNDHEGICKNFDILADDTYIWFEDPNVEAALKAYYTNITTKGIRASDIGDNNTSWMDMKVFQNRYNNPDPNSYGAQITSFNELSKLTNIKTIVHFQFNGCSKLRSIDLSNITTFSGSNDGNQGHFAGCTSLTSLGDTTNIQNLGPNAAFWKCSSLPSFTLGPLITKIPKNCFYNCTSLTTINGSPQNLQTLGNSCFEGCSSLQNINIDLSNLTYIGDACFKGCSSLQQISLPTNLTTIPWHCFNGCTSLSTITGANNVTSLGDDCFRDCSSLTDIDIDWTKITKLGTSCTSNSSLKIPFNDISHIQEIGKYALNGNKTIGSSLALDSVNGISEYAFSSNSSITSLVIKSPRNVNISGRAFEFCTNLTTVDFSQSLMTKFNGNGSFYGCSNLVSVKLPLTVTQFGAEWSANPLTKCDSLTELRGLDNVTSLITGISSNCNLNHAIYLKELTQGKALPIWAVLSENKHPYLKQLYMPKFQYSTLTTYNLTGSRAITSMISYQNREPVGNNTGSNSGQLGYIDLIYFRDIQRIAYFQFYGGRFKYIIINNNTPPQIDNSIDTSNLVNINNYNVWSTNLFGLTQWIDRDNTTTIDTVIYVPDSAKSAYEADNNYNIYTIRGINEIDPNTGDPYLPKYATNELWEAAGKPSNGLIEEYM